MFSRGFSVAVFFTTLVWDNNNFDEETYTGMQYNLILIKILKHLMTFKNNLNINKIYTDLPAVFNDKVLR